MSLYSIGKMLFALFYKLCFHITVEGTKNIPDDGGVLICSNHMSNFDPPLIGTSVARDLSFVSKEELFEVPLLGRLLRRVHAFPIKRGAGDRGAIRVAVRLIREGHALLIFPEGTRNRSGHLQKGLSGAGFFALKTDVTVIPCAIIGTYKFRSRVKVVFGSPVDTASMKRERLKPSAASAVIMDHIRQLQDQYGK